MMLNNKLLKIFLTLLFVVICQIFFCVQNASNNIYELLIEDDANLLTIEQKDELKKDMAPLVKYGNIIFKSSDFSNSSTTDLARSYYHNRFGTNSGTVFYIDMYNREIYVFSDGYNYEIINTGKALSITDNVYRDASKGDYYKCASKAYAQMFILLSANENENMLLRFIAYLKFQEPMKIVCNAIFAVLISSFICFLVVFGKYRIKEEKDKEIIDKARHFIKIKNINAHLTGVRKIYNPHTSSSSSSSSSSSGGSRSSSSSSSSGGGGGHRF